jgi:hypothetical protein
VYADAQVRQVDDEQVYELVEDVGAWPKRQITNRYELADNQIELWTWRYCSCKSLSSNL